MVRGEGRARKVERERNRDRERQRERLLMIPPCVFCFLFVQRNPHNQSSPRKGLDPPIKDKTQ